MTLTNVSAEGAVISQFLESLRGSARQRLFSQSSRLGQYHADALLKALDHLHAPAQHAQRPFNQRARVAAIYKKSLRTLKVNE